MKDNWIGEVGIWGQRHYQYLKENKPTVHCADPRHLILALEIFGYTLVYCHLTEKSINHFFRLFIYFFQILFQTAVHPHHTDYILRERATEIVNADIIYI